jgi:formate-dependent nitrite reductase cytochrome c552 subunit
MSAGNHSKAFTLQDFSEPIKITAKNANILQANCIKCHSGFVHEILKSKSDDRTIPCVHCHRSAGHGEIVGLGGPERTSDYTEINNVGMKDGSRNSPGKSTYVAIGVALASALVTVLLVNIIERKSEAKNAYVQLEKVTEDTTDPAVWGVNWPRQYDSYKRTAIATRTRFGGHGGSEALPEEKIDRDPWLKRMFLGYAFSTDYRDRRGHGFMLQDQEQTERQQSRSQVHACIATQPSCPYTGGLAMVMPTQDSRNRINTHIKN